MRKQLIKDIIAFLQSNTKLFFNERDLQMNLAVYLSKKYNITTECGLSLNVSDSEIPDNMRSIDGKDHKMRIDLVAEMGGVYVPIEIKYTLTNKKGSLPDEIPSLFGASGARVIENQGAHNIICYNYWSDVERLEYVKQRYNTAQGIALFVTNDQQYWNLTTNQHVDYYSFRLIDGRDVGDGITSTELDWATPRMKGDKKGHVKPILLHNKYCVRWKDITPAPMNTFKYLIL